VSAGGEGGLGAALREGVENLLREPAAVEALLLFLLLALALLVLRRMGRVARDLSRRKEVAQFVQGMTHYLQEEWQAAADLLKKVVERDPENLEARVTLGDCLRMLGNAAEAHRQHYQVYKVFQSDLPRNYLSLGRDHLALGQEEEAIAMLRRAVAGDPRNREAFDELVRALERRGDHEEAFRLRTRRRGGGLEPEEAGRLLGSAAVRRFADGDAAGGARLLEQALRRHPGLLAPRFASVMALLQAGDEAGARSAFLRHLREVEAVAARSDLVLEGPPAPIALPAAAGTRALPAARGPVEATPAIAAVAEGAGELRTLVGILEGRLARYRCGACGAAFPEPTPDCARCGAAGTLRPIQGPLRPEPRLGELLDEVEENRDHLRRLVRGLAAGETEAAAKLERLGDRATEAVVEGLARGEDRDRLEAFLRSAGARALPAMAVAWRAIEGDVTDQVLLPSLVRVGVAAGAAGVGFFRALVRDPSRPLRLWAFDVLARLGAAAALEEARDTLPLREALVRLGALAPAELETLAATAPPGGFLLTRVLPDRTFPGGAALAAAFLRSGGEERLAIALRARGFSAEAFAVLSPALGREETRAVASGLLRDFGEAAVDHLVGALADAAASEDRRAATADVLAAIGPRAAGRLVEALEEASAAVDRAALRALGRMGDAVVPALVALYGRGSPLQLLGFAPGRRERRRHVLRALAALGTPAALRALDELAAGETDRELATWALRLREEGGGR
jgi:tetratricopeptide (TPR) repeat protein